MACVASYALLFACIVGVEALLPRPIFHNNGQLSQTPFDWSSINSEEELNFTSCYDNFECARLSLRLDWHHDYNRHNISLAVIRLPAVVPADHPSHGGSIILNPGGPGGSGILFTLAAARALQTLVDGPRYYDIVSFDPRGVFHSTPIPICFYEGLENEIWYREKRAVGALDSSEYALKYHYATEKARGKLCAANEQGRYEDGVNVRNHLSTAYVARDMLELVYKLDTHKKAAIVATGHDTQKVVDGEPPPQLQYIGVSYGTFLGQTFAALYPEHVGRMVLDSNLDADNFVSQYEASVDDHEAIRGYFFDRCFAGQQACPFWRLRDQNAISIRSRYDSLVSQLRESPVPIATNGHTALITEDSLDQGFFATLYQPIYFFKLFAQILSDLYDGQQPMYPFWFDPLPTRETFDDETLDYILHNREVSAAIHCSDSPDYSATNFTSFQDYLSNLTSRFPHAGAWQAEWKLTCYTLPASLRPKWRHNSPFNSSVPILFVNNRLDPVTPLKNAKKMAAQFAGSRVLVQDHVGHGALFPANLCMWLYVRGYLQGGVLPEEDASCTFPCEPFDGQCGLETMESAPMIWH